jgi:predicted peptidase
MLQLWLLSTRRQLSGRFLKRIRYLDRETKRKTMKREIHVFRTIITAAVCATLILLMLMIYKVAPLSESTSITSYAGYSSYVFSDTHGNSLSYYLYMPSNYNPAKKYPLVLLLHGGGQRGTPTNTVEQNASALLNDPYALVWSTDYNAAGNPHIQQHWPCFVVVPQLSTGQNWVNVPVHNGSYQQPAQPSAGLLAAKELLDTLQNKYTSIDANRLYITGLSLGGYGTWDAVERWPHYFAAAVPIAGAGDPSKASLLKDLPIWAFHGSVDATVPVEGSRDMIAAIRAAGGHPGYTEFPNQGHGVWGWVYGLNEGPLLVTNFYPWLFSQHK